MNIYNNYHKHSHYTSAFIVDSPVTPEDYAKRIKELGYGSLFTTEHGYGGDIFENKKVADKYGIKCIFAMEGYIVPNASEKDAANYHIVIIPTTNTARKKLNKASSRANKEGFYYKPRLFLQDLLSFDKNDLYITTACIGGLLSDERSIQQILLPLIRHFGNNVFFEVQPHNEARQKEVNQLALQMAKQYDCEIIAANDSHYIYENQKEDRVNLLKGKRENYDDENNYMLDYPDYDTFVKRFRKQGILNDEEIERALKNTLLLDNCDNISINKEIKMPNIYPDNTANERIKKLKQIINRNFKDIIKQDEIPKEDLPKYLEAIRYEMQIIEDTAKCKTMDYFLLNERIVDLAVNKYNGTLTKTGRGSNSGFYINRVLHITEIDRLKSEIPLYPERFMSVPRIIEEHSLPDNDYNTANAEPFINATKELLGENGCYHMLTYGTQQESDAFRNVCRAKGLKFEDYNEIGKDIDKYKESEKWKEIIEYSQRFIDVITSASVHPCSCLLMTADIEEEIGIIKVGDYYCAVITSDEADEWKYLKNDYLTVSVWDIIAQVFQEIGQPIMSLKELKRNIDSKVWDIYEKGLTCTINQVDGDWATKLVKEYKPSCAEELAKFTGAIRPSFESFRDDWINRKPYSCGIPQIDKLFKTSDGRVLFQENLIQFFEWLGVTPAHSIGIIKKISKKKIKPEDFEKLEKGLREHWIQYIGNDDNFDKVWQDMQSNMGYGYNSPHAISMAYDSIYCAYLKSHYPLEYYTVVLNFYAKDNVKTAKLIEEMKAFGIQMHDVKFRKSGDNCQKDVESNSIYRGVSSIKHLNNKIGNTLYSLRYNQYESFTDCLYDIFENKCCNSKQIKILIELGYFQEFGGNKKLLEVFDIFKALQNRSTIKVTELASLQLDAALVSKFSNSLKLKSGNDAKSYTVTDMKALIKEKEMGIPSNNLDITEQLRVEAEYLGSCSSLYDCDENYYFIVDMETKYSPILTLYNLSKGNTLRIKTYKKNVFYKNEQIVDKFNIVQISTIESKPRKRFVNGEWIELEERENILTGFSVIKRYAGNLIKSD